MGYGKYTLLKIFDCRSLRSIEMNTIVIKFIFYKKLLEFTRNKKGLNILGPFLKIIRGHSCLGLYFIKPSQLPKSPAINRGAFKIIRQRSVNFIFYKN